MESCVGCTGLISVASYTRIKEIEHSLKSFINNVLPV